MWKNRFHREQWWDVIGKVVSMFIVFGDIHLVLEG
jgi:hypothetical protein